MNTYYDEEDFKAFEACAQRIDQIQDKALQAYVRLQAAAIDKAIATVANSNSKSKPAEQAAATASAVAVDI